jgi:hypothetical protein
VEGAPGKGCLILLNPFYNFTNFRLIGLHVHFTRVHNNLFTRGVRLHLYPRSQVR